MPPKRSPPSSSSSAAVPSTSTSKRPQTQGQQGGAASTVGSALRNTYEALTARENQSVVRAVGMFGVAVAFFASSYSDILPSMVPV